jgi:hypothetical protein
MARTFTKNTSNRMSLGTNAVGPLISGATKVSVLVRAKLASITGGADDNRLVTVEIDSNFRGIVLCINNSGGSPVLRAGGRSVSGDSFQAVDGSTAVTTGAFHTFSATLDFTAKTILAYLDGVQDASGSSLSFANNSFTLGTPSESDMIGSDINPPSTTAIQVDGDIAELAFWTTGLSADEHKLAGKYNRSPLRIQRPSLVAYVPLRGVSSPEPGLISGLSGTITGTVAAAAHPHVSLNQLAQVGCS